MTLAEIGRKLYPYGRRGEIYCSEKYYHRQNRCVYPTTRFIQHQCEYFVVSAKINVMVFISGNNCVFVLAGITLILEETHFLNEYVSLFPVLQSEVLFFIKIKTSYDVLNIVVCK